MKLHPAWRVQRIRAHLPVRQGLHIVFVTQAFLVWHVIQDQQRNVSGFGSRDQRQGFLLAMCLETLQMQTIPCRGVLVVIAGVLQTGCRLHHLKCITQLAMAIAPDAAAMDPFLFSRLSPLKLLVLVRHAPVI